MARIGIVNNPLARRNRRRPETPRLLRRLLGADGALVDAATEEAVAEALAGFRRAGVEVLAVNGGDGTLAQVVTALPRDFGPPPWPMLLPLPGGSMNNVARAHGHRGSPQRVLERVLASLRAGGPLPSVERDLLSVEADGGGPRLGFLFATGAAVRFLDLWYEGERHGPARAAWVLLRLLASALSGGRLAREIARREPLRVVADGDEWPAGEWLSVLAGAVPGLGLGSRPFSRCDEQPGFFHAVGVTASPLRLVLALPSLWRGRPWRRQVAVDAVARDLAVEPVEPLRYTLDGDLYQAGSSLRVRTGPLVEVVVDPTSAPPHRLPVAGLTAREGAR
ncbi:MAG TPA: diacylglycerol kinase family protein [Anaeromyxobacteraceae bacterium]|nr:diacylglycerol kinase family protein [Anaeromyxobacteraceae bacterium]